MMRLRTAAFRSVPMDSPTDGLVLLCENGGERLLDHWLGTAQAPFAPQGAHVDLLVRLQREVHALSAEDYLAEGGARWCDCRVENMARSAC